MSLNYYEIGTPDEPVVSSSSLVSLDPTTGGSIIKFKQFFADREEVKIKTSLNNGKLIHSYQEDPDNFAIEDFDKPTEMMSRLLERVILNKSHLSLNSLDTVNTAITSKTKTVSTRDAEIAEIKLYFEKLASILNLNIEDTIRVFRASRIETNSYTSYGELKVLSNIITEDSALKYLTFLEQASNKHVINAETKEKVVGAITAITLHPVVSVLLGLKTDDIDGLVVDTECQRFKELPIFWSEKIKIPFVGGAVVTIPCKALLDNLHINHRTKVITYNDLKSTGHSIYTYQKSFEFYRTYRQMAFYKRAISFWFKAVFPDKIFSEYTLKVNVIPVETFGNFLTAPYEVSEEWLNKGSVECRELLSRLAWHIYNKEYTYSLEERVNKGFLKFNKPTND